MSDAYCQHCERTVKPTKDGNAPKHRIMRWTGKPGMACPGSGKPVKKPPETTDG